MRIDFPPKFEPLFRPYRYKVFYGGRGGAKSWQFARAAVLDAYQRRHLWLCAREFQNSIRDSVHQVLATQIEKLALLPWFTIQKTEIACRVTGSRFIFKGLHHNVGEIKSLEGVDRCWVEEAQNISRESLDVLVPTIRREGSEIWFSYNPRDESDAVHQTFVMNPPPARSVVVKVGWKDNPHFPDVLDQERRWLLERDPDAYAWVWDGECRALSDAAVFRNVVVEGFDSPPIGGPRDTVRWRFGADWGFAADPSTLVRSYIRDGVCYVDAEAYGLHVELDGIDAFWRTVPGSSTHRIYADSSRPETISHMVRRGWDCRPCRKGPGSVEDGIAFLQNFPRIVVHPRCKHLAEEMRLYKWKVAKTAEEITRAPEDRNNHCIDALRYAYDEDINHRRSGLDISPRAMAQFMTGMRRP